MTEIRSRKARWFHLPTWKVKIIFLLGAVLVGITSALFAELSEIADHTFRNQATQRPWLPFLSLPLGLGLLSWLTHRYVPAARGSGIPQTIAALKVGATHRIRESVLAIHVAVTKILFTCLGLLFGASIGREGPTVHVGVAIMYSLARFAHFPAHFMERGLILAGGAAGLAAAFNTPLAGVMFAIEEMGRSFDRRTSGIVLSAVVVAGLTAMFITGNYDYFGTASGEVDTPMAWLAVPVCGVLGGLLGGGFSTLLIRSSQAISGVYRRHPVLVAMVCGLVVAMAGYASGGAAYGTGYEEARKIIETGESSGWLYPIYKFIATIASYLSGIPGGIFAPSLSIGAGFGANLGQLFPSVSLETIILLGMVAYFTGVVQTPITAFIIVTEMTNYQDMAIPLMATALIANWTSQMVCKTAIYEAMAVAFLGAQVQSQEDQPGSKPPST